MLKDKMSMPMNKLLGIWRHHESYLFDYLLGFIEWLLGYA